VIWLAWRQFRVPALIAAGILGVLAVVFAITGPGIAHIYNATVATCAAHGDCGSVQANFLGKDRLLQTTSVVVVILPALLGIFWGAPLIARELETGTYRLALTQSVTRSRWIATKFCLVGLASMVTAGLFSLMVTWWSSPFDRLRDSPFSSFDHRDIVPIGYAAFAFALGVVLGVLIRRVLPAMATTLVVFIAVRLAFTNWIRQRFATPLHLTIPFQAPGPGFNGGQGMPSNPGDWVISEQTINSSGKVIGSYGGIGPNGDINFRGAANGATYFQGVGKCPNKIPSPPPGVRGSNVHLQPSPAVQHAIQKCVNSFHLRSIATYQPTSRYWTFQWYELTIFIVMALLLSAFAWWWIRRRVA
jgi:hypothetical protein